MISLHHKITAVDLLSLRLQRMHTRGQLEQIPQLVDTTNGATG